VTTLAEDVKNPRKNVLLAAVSICGWTGLFGGLLVYLGHSVWPNYATFDNVDTAFIDVTGRVGGVLLLKATALLIVLANVGGGLTRQVGAARLLFGMGRENVIPARYFARLHPRRNTPDINIVLIGILAFIGALIMSYEFTAELLNFGAFLGFMGVNAAVVWRFWVRPTDPISRNIVLDVLLPVLAFIFCTVIWLGLGLSAQIAGGLWLVIGFVVLATHTRWFRRPFVLPDPSAKGENGWSVNLELSQWQTPGPKIVIHLHPADGRRLNTASVGQIVENSIVIPASAVPENRQLSIRVS
jgi:putrescine importer